MAVRANRGDKILVELDLVALSSAAGLGSASTNIETALTQALNAALLQSTTTLAASLPSNTTVNVLPLLLALGITIPPSLISVGGVNLAAVPVSLLLQGSFLQLIDPLVMSSIASQVNGLLRPSVTLTVVDGVSGPDGKWPGSLGNVVVLEVKRVGGVSRCAFDVETRFRQQTSPPLSRLHCRPTLR
jgi:hypothetical protein